MIKLKDILFEDYNYRGNHTAPVKDDYSAPLHNVTELYPDDIYTLSVMEASRIYGDRSSEYSDFESLNIIRKCKGKPNEKVKIYRAVPKVETKDEAINRYELEKKYILKHGKLPQSADTEGIFSRTASDMQVSSAYYEYANDMIEKLKNGTISLQSINMDINPGDWVTINRRYAVMHGKSSLNNKYKILSKTVPASHLYTTADSLHEWGYEPT